MKSALWRSPCWDTALHRKRNIGKTRLEVQLNGTTPKETTKKSKAQNHHTFSFINCFIPAWHRAKPGKKKGSQASRIGTDPVGFQQHIGCYLVDRSANGSGRWTLSSRTGPPKASDLDEVAKVVGSSMAKRRKSPKSTDDFFQRTNYNYKNHMNSSKSSPKKPHWRKASTAYVTKTLCLDGSEIEVASLPALWQACEKDLWADRPWAAPQ